ncbi:MAG: hypothetical protein KGI26_06985 [Thaumarchaeota archaeon]|nr:hypothetical protein [Nitrososphaerota archaeon]
MKATQARKASITLLVASALLLLLTLTLPQYKVPETATQVVPPTANPPGGYMIYGYGIPPVVEGSTISVALSGFGPRLLEYSLAPTQGNLILNPIAFGRVGDGPAENFSAIAGGNYALELSIIAYNGTGFTIAYHGIWSPYDFLVVYISPAVFLVAASLAGTYYFGTRIPRQRNEERVEAELREAKASGARP